MWGTNRSTVCAEMNERVNGYRFNGRNRNKATVTGATLENCFVCAHIGSIST